MECECQAIHFPGPGRAIMQAVEFSAAWPFRQAVLAPALPNHLGLVYTTYLVTGTGLVLCHVLRNNFRGR